MQVVVSNINMAPLKSQIKNNEVSFTDYGQYIQPFLDSTSLVYHPDTTQVLIFLDGDELLRDQLYSIPDKETYNGIDARLHELFSIIERYNQQQKDKVTLVINSIVFYPRSFMTFVNKNTENNFNRLEDHINGRIYSFASSCSNIIVLDWKQLVKLHGINQLYAWKYWYLGRIKLSKKGFTVLCDEYDSLILAYGGQSKKVLVLDLDNTLWGGIIGEDGVGGIELSEDGIGKAYRDFQKIIRSLLPLGILLCINSKNNENDVLDVFTNHPMMTLKLDDFVSKKINWETKVQNMLEIQSELNLGLDSFVFIDDSPVERQIIKESLPQVVVPEFPKDTSQISEWFINDVIYKYFPKLHITSEDAVKTQQYSALTKRQTLAKKLDLTSFLNELQIHLKLNVNPLNASTRIAQLTQKTNQFNLTTRRYTISQIETFITSQNIDVFTLEYSDRFGIEGIVGICIVKKAGTSIILDDFLLSCRVLSRNVEFAFLYAVLTYYQKKEVIEIYGEFIPTQKNSISEHFLSNVGMIKKDDKCLRQNIDNVLQNLKPKLHYAELKNGY